MMKRRWVRVLFVMALSMAAFVVLMIFPCWSEKIMLVNGTGERFPRIDIKFGNQVLWRGSLGSFDGYWTCVYVPDEGGLSIEAERADGKIFSQGGPYTTEMGTNDVNLFHILRENIEYTGISSLFMMTVNREDYFYNIASLTDSILTKITCPATMIMQKWRNKSLRIERTLSNNEKFAG